MDPGADASGLGESPNPSPSTTSSSPAVAVDTQVPTKDTADPPLPPAQQVAAAAASSSGQPQPQPRSRYESQKRRDWNSFVQYLKNHKPSSLTLSRCSGAHVIEFLKYLDQFGKTKVHDQGCPYFGHPSPPVPCACPLRQAWGSLDALIGRLRAAYEENGVGSPGSNLFGAKAVRIYLREVRESQEKARGIPYQKKRRKRQTMMSSSNAKESPGSSSAAAAAVTLKAAADDVDESSKKLQLRVVRRPPTPRN